MPDLTITCSRCNSLLHHECHPETLEEAALDLFQWRPESGFPKALKKGNDYCDGNEDDETVPFLTESFLYPLLGKEDARTLLARIHALFRAMGVEPRNFEENAWRLLDEKKKDKEAEQVARAAARKRYREHMLPITRVKQESGLYLCTYRSFYCFDVNVAECSNGECFERANADLRTERKTPQLGTVITDADGMHVTCALCKRLHLATTEQVANWRKEPRYPTRAAENGLRGPTRPEHWLRAEVLFTALGFTHDSERRVASK